MKVEQKVAEFKEKLDQVKEEISKMMVGQEAVIREVLIALLGGGNILLEGVPGLGKTLLVRSMGEVMDLSFSRIQFTPDLMPADITGTHLVVEREPGRREFEFQKGPVFANLVLADEINRATPKTQSALLEAMQERSVTAAGNRFHLPEPFMVLATQNPIEMEGTYPLPEAQTDRFMFKTMVTFPSLEELQIILNRTTDLELPVLQKRVISSEIIEMKALCREVLMGTPVNNYVCRLVMATHPDNDLSSDAAKKYVRYGASPRGGQALVLGAKVNALMEGRFNVSFEDVKKVALPSLRHRLILNFEAQAEGIETDTIIEQLLREVPHEAEIKTG